MVLEDVGGGGHPSVPPSLPQTSDTPYASPEPSRRSRGPSPPPLLHAEKQNTQAARPSSDQGPPASPLPSPRSARSQSLITTGSSPSATANHPIKRKPLSSTASPLATRYSSRDHLEILPKPEQRFSRSCSVDSPTLYEFPARAAIASLDNSPSSLVSQGGDHFVEGSPPASNNTPWPASRDVGLGLDLHAGALESRNISGANPAAPQTPPTEAPSEHEDLTADYYYYLETDTAPTRAEVSELPNNHNINPNNTMSLFARKPSPPHLTLGSVDTTGHRATTPAELAEPAEPAEQAEHAETAATLPIHENKADIHKPLPKSPSSSKLGTFFGWSAGSPSSVDFSDKGFSPLPSPFSPKPTTVFTHDSPVSSQGTHSSKINAAEDNPLGYCEDLQTPPAHTPSPPVQIEEMEDELKAISAELAASIRREMDLEDLVDRLQAEISNPQAPGKRTSDYFSDSGYSSAKFSEYDASKEEVAQIQRRAEQEKAQIRLELTDKLSDERSRRKALDQQIKELSQRASNLDMAQLRNQDASGRVKELESTCDDLRRRLSEERQVKDNFEDLLSALKNELRSAANERDNLRDEIVPQLRARVEGLEAQASEHAKLTYESTKMQQELQTLKTENTTLRSSSRSDNDSRMSVVRAKSNSVTGNPGFKLQQPPLSRSNTVKGQTESREALAERLKDVEAQRDALHSALKNLLERQEHQNRENDKKIKVLETERDRLLATSPGKAGYEKEVSNLRQEINVLRRRAEEAVEQKWQVEKGLSGLKMDLDRAEEEIAGLRSLLKEKDILIPAGFARSSGSSTGSSQGLVAVAVTSASLEGAYQDLQQSYAEALERIKALEFGPGTSASQDEKTRLALQRLEQSLAASVSERDMARHEATSYRTRLDSLEASEKKHLQSERGLAAQLQESARRVEELAQQVRSQLETNASLRARLADTVARGEAEQKSNKERIAGMQVRLKTLEDQLIATQTAAEERVTRHEDEVASLKEAHNTQLQRLRDSSGLRSPRLFPSKSPLSPMFAAANGAKSPLLSPRPSPRRSATMPAGDSEREQLAQIETLKARVAELEAALTATDSEMQEVVSRMNTAQIEVLQLQEERETAARETRKLQRQLETEKVKTFEERFKTLSS